MEQEEPRRKGSSENDPIVLWRAEELQRAGFRPVLADRLAARRDVDLHLAVDLLKKGCPDEMAIRILL